MENRKKQNMTTTHFDELIRARLKMQGDNTHHLEVVAVHNNIEWINNSISTSIEMTWHAMRDVNGPVILILGGVDRADDQHRLKEIIDEKVQTIICLGSTPWKYFEAFREASVLIAHAKNLEEAIHFAFLLSKAKPRTVLFSPSCPSYDAFDNYKNRGNAFRRIVNERINKVK